MNLRSIIYPPVANYVYKKYIVQSKNIIEEQEKQLLALLKYARNTEIGQKYHFNEINSYDEYRNRIPTHNYGDLQEQIEKISTGKTHVLWPGLPKYFAITSGTQSGKKFIPITNEGLKSQKIGRLTAMANYSIKYNKLDHLKGPMLFFSARPSFVQFGKYKATLLSSLMAETIPNWMKKYNLPSAEIHKIEAFEDRISFMVKEALANRNNLRGIVAFPPWLHLFLNELENTSGKTFGDLFPQFQLLVTSGMAYTPYAGMVSTKMQNDFDRIETFPASEGFISFTDTLDDPGMSLMPSNGVFFEFVESKNIHDSKPKRICLAETEAQVDYALIVTSNAGLWSYVLGDTIKFLSTNPWKLIITGRVGQTISLVSENVTVSDTDACVSEVCRQNNLTLYEYVCSGSITSQEYKPRYEWILECDRSPTDKNRFAIEVHETMKKLNVLYEEYAEDGIIQIPEVHFVPKGFFIAYLEQNTKIDAQQKLEHICRDYSKFCKYKNFELFAKTT